MDLMFMSEILLIRYYTINIFIAKLILNYPLKVLLKFLVFFKKLKVKSSNSQEANFFNLKKAKKVP